MEKDQLPRRFWHYCGNESMNWTVVQFMPRASEYCLCNARSQGGDGGWGGDGGREEWGWRE